MAESGKKIGKRLRAATRWTILGALLRPSRRSRNKAKYTRKRKHRERDEK